MTADIIIPHVGETTTSVRIARWLKAEGESVSKGEPVLEIDTDKSTIEIEALADGVLERIVVPEDQEADAMQVVGVIRVPAGDARASNVDTRNGGEASADDRLKSPLRSSDQVSPLARKLADELGVPLDRVAGTGPGGRITQADVRSFAAQGQQAISAPHAASSRASASPPARQPATPKARRLAAELGMDIAALTPSSPDGLIRSQDVQAAAPTLLTPPTPVIPPTLPTPSVHPLSRQRRAIAARMVASKRDVPHFYLLVEVDMKQALRLRQYCLDALGWERKPTINDLIVRAAALALKAMPRVNVSCQADGDGYMQHDEVNLGIAVSNDDGLLVPVLQRVDQLDLRQTSERARELVVRARQGRLREGDFGAKSMVISNLGAYGMDAFFAIIDPPDPMILAVGRVADRITPVDGRAAIRPMCMLTLSADHRMLDGALAAAYLSKVKTLLEQPFELLVKSA
jgi:pyruvate dehydrogenase E2 component (dihydrolipoamide acetyltransferase)